MKRISDENGAHAGARNIGRFFLFAIPLVLGLAASVWFGLWVSGYEFGRLKESDQKKDDAYRHELTQQERSAVYVGAGTRPKGKLAVEVVPKTCFVIVRADIDTKKRGYPYDDDAYNYSLILYGQNNCKESLDYVSYHWQMVSPNGAVLSGNYKNSCPIPGIGEIAECRFDIDSDERADKFRVWGQSRP